MCGRIVQKSGPLDYVERIFPTSTRYSATRPAALQHPAGHASTHNAPARRRVRAGPAVVDLAPERFEVRDELRAARQDRRGKMAVEDAHGHGRILVPADGWYEWKALTDEPKPPKQPYYIHAADNTPLFFAALSNWRAGAEKDEAHGCNRHERLGRRHGRRSRPAPSGATGRSCNPLARPGPPCSPGCPAARARPSRNGLHLAPGPARGRQLEVPAPRRHRAGAAYPALTLSNRTIAAASDGSMPWRVPLAPTVRTATDGPPARDRFASLPGRPSSNRPSAPTGSRRPWSALFRKNSAGLR